MNEHQFSIGDRVKATYKTGIYIGEIIEISSFQKHAVQVLEVVKHPTQGDLHHPLRADVPFFHQRRALNFHEVALVPISDIEKTNIDTGMDYNESLKKAWSFELLQMQKLLMQKENIEWTKRCIDQLEQLGKEYSFLPY